MLKRTCILALCVLFLGPAFGWASGCSSPVEIEKSLLIRDLSVVDSALAQPRGPLHFGSILRQLSPNITTPSQFVHTWFGEWSRNEIGGKVVQPRIGDRLLNFWRTLPDGSLDIDQSPFRLLAIAFRGDVTTPEAPNGEARLVYTAYTPGALEPFEFLVIFEFALDGSRADWSRRFRELSCLEFGDAYNRAVSALASDFTRHLSQIRTNDFFLEAEWELREFRLDPLGFVRAAPVALTPELWMSEAAQSPLVDWARQNEAAILANNFSLPESLWGPSAPMSHERFGWLRNAGLDPLVRHRISFNTCSGCHASETRTIFTHIFPRGRGQVSRISRFLGRDLLERKQIMEATNPLPPGNRLTLGERETLAENLQETTKTLLKNRRHRVH